MSYNIRTTLDVQDNLNIGLNASISGSLSVTGSIYGNLNGTATSASYATTASYVSSNFQYEIHVSQVDGNDTTGNGDLLKPVATIGKALLIVSASVASTDRRTIIVHPGTYIENITINTTNTYFFSTGLLGANCLISGSVTVSAATRMSGLKMTNLIVSSSAPVYINNCAVDKQMTVSGSGYLEVQNTSLQCTSGIQVVGPASSGVIFENCSLYPLTVNNASAAVYVISCNQAITPTLTAGALTITRSTISSLTSGATSTALTTAAGSVLVLESCNVYNSLLTSHAAITANGFYSIKNIIYNRSASTLASLSGTGGPLATVSQFQYINADNITSTQGLAVTGSINVSGSQQITGSLNVTQGITGSLFGTSSWAQNALTASFAPNYLLLSDTGSFATTGSNTFIGNQTITGSLTVSSSNNTQLLIGTNTLFVSSSGQVGIGTTGSIYKLDILTTSGDTNYLRIAGNGVSNTNGNITLGNVTGAAGVFAPLLSSKSSNLSYPGMYFIGDGASGTDSGTTPMIRFDGRINNGAVSTRPLIGFSNAGTDLVTILANGNTGVGTNSPSTKLQVRGASSGSGTTAFRVENSNASASLTITDAGVVTTGGALVIGSTATAAPVNGSATIQAVFGNHAGQFEIRPNNLSSLIYFSNGGSGGGMYLGVSKYFSTPYSVYASGSVIVGDYSGFTNNTAAPARFAVSGSNNQTLVNIESPGSSSIFNVSGSGNVGIGTSTPAVKLDVFGTGQIINMGNGTSADAYIDFAGNRGKFGFESATGIRFQGTNTRPIVFALGNWGTGEIARFSTQGFFGLNTTTPSAWLHISGTIASSSLFKIDAPGSASIFEVSGSGVVTINGAIPVTRNATGYNVTRFTNSASFDNIRVAISSSGNPVASSVSGSVNVFYSAISSVAGSAISSSVNTGAIFTTGSWSILTSATLGSGGDTITSHIQDQDRGRLYRATFIQTAGPASGSVVIERLI